MGYFWLRVDLEDIEKFDFKLCDKIRMSPKSHIDNLEKAVGDVFKAYNPNSDLDDVEW
jgi:DNA replicative helicase MCM subunit Mcm2 (Cdc46/Mcm family)